MEEQNNKKELLKERMKKYKQNARGYKNDHGKTATTRNLTRIIIYLSNVDYANRTKIQKELGLDSPQLKDAINFLGNHKIISKVVTKIGGRQRMGWYVLNPLFKK